MSERRRTKGKAFSDSDIPEIVVEDKDENYASRKKSRKSLGRHEREREDVSPEGSPRQPHSRSRSFGGEDDRKRHKSRHRDRAREPEDPESPPRRKSAPGVNPKEEDRHRHRRDRDRDRDRDVGGQESPRSRKSVLGQDVQPSGGQDPQRKSLGVINPSAENSATDSRRKNRRKTDTLQLVAKPVGWKHLLYEKNVFIGLNCFGMFIGIISLLVVPILYLVLPRDFAGQTQNLSVIIFLILALCALGVSYILISSFAFVMYNHKFYKIGYVFNGNPFELLLYVVGFIFVIWILSTVKEKNVKLAMRKAIEENNLDPWHSVQAYFQCCGITHYLDWFDYNRSENIPESCCTNLACKKNYSTVSQRDVWESGCLETVLSTSHALNWTSFFLLLIGIIVTSIGMVSVREAYNHKDSPKHAVLFFEPSWMMPFTRGPKAVRGRGSHENPQISSF